MTLRKRIAMAFISLSVLIILTTAAVLYQRAAAVIRQEVQQIMTVQLDRASENINLLIELNRAETNVLAKDASIRTFFGGRLSKKSTDAYLVKLMADKNKVRNVYKDLFVTNKDGRILATTMDDAQNLDLSGRDYFETSKYTGETVTSDILVARSDGENIIITMAPILDENRWPIGYAGIALKATFFSEFMKSFSEDPNGYYIILDSKQLVLSHPDPGKIARLLEKPESWPEIGSGWQFDRTGKHLYKQMILPQTKWRLLAIMNESAIEQKAIDLLWSTMIVGFSLILIAGLMIYYLSRKISEPIESIIQALNHASERQMMLRNRLPEAIRLNDGTGLDEISRLNMASARLRNVIESHDLRTPDDSQRLKETLENLTREIEENHKRTYDFLSVLSHDMRTPLTLIKGYSRGIEQHGNQDEIRIRYAEGILENTLDIEKLIYDVLDSAYEVNNGFVFDLEMIEAGEFVRQIEQEARLSLVQGDQRLIVTIEAEAERAAILIDAAKIRRVVFNLLNNAFKYAWTDTEIHFSLKKTGSGLRFAVTNLGSGIPEDEQQSIFEMFYRGRGATGKGYGMGLHIAARIIRGHGSLIELISEKDGTTEFFFCLPEA